jgi:sugar phosphate isomerase/epimerase
MRLSSSTGDFSYFVNSVSEKVRLFKDTKFRYINLEQTGDATELLSDNEEDWRRFANECAEAAKYANKKLVISHAPCLHTAIPEAILNKENEVYQRNIRAIRRSIEVCHMLGIPRIVIHACTHPSFTKESFVKYNEAFYNEFFDLAEKYDIMLLTENWDNDASFFSTGKDMRELIDKVGHPLFAACWDTAHGNIAKEARATGQYENIMALGDKLKGLHISDNFGDTHHHTWPFAGIINFDEVMQALVDINYDGYFNFEASYTLIRQENLPYRRKAWEHNGKTVTTLLNPSVTLKQKAVDLLFDVGQHIL